MTHYTAPLRDMKFALYDVIGRRYFLGASYKF